MIFSTPSLEYGALSPMLVILGDAVLAVIIEAFVSARLRPAVQLALAIGAVLLALGQVIRLRGIETITTELTPQMVGIYPASGFPSQARNPTHFTSHGLMKYKT